MNRSCRCGSLSSMTGCRSSGQTSLRQAFDSSKPSTATSRSNVRSLKRINQVKRLQPQSGSRVIERLTRESQSSSEPHRSSVDFSLWLGVVTLSMPMPMLMLMLLLAIVSLNGDRSQVCTLSTLLVATVLRSY
jgi:hypothetical protein